MITREQFPPEFRARYDTFAAEAASVIDQLNPITSTVPANVMAWVVTQVMARVLFKIAGHNEVAATAHLMSHTGATMDLYREHARRARADG